MRLRNRGEDPNQGSISISDHLQSFKHKQKSITRVSISASTTKDGRASYEIPNVGRFSGHVKDYLAEGFGVLETKAGVTYKGQWHENKANGKGRLADLNRDSYYEGQFTDGARDGHGVKRWQNGDEYTGHWKEGKMDGAGAMSFANGEYYKGDWKDGYREGKGVFQWVNGNVYEGEFKKNMPDGNGK